MRPLPTGIRTIGFLAFCIASAAMTGLAASQEGNTAEQPQAATPPANPWVVNCSSGQSGTALQCQMSQNLTEAQTGQRVLTVTIRPQPGESRMAMLLALPHGLYLPAGATYQIDSGQKATAVIQTSDQNGAYAAVPLVDELVQAMKAGTTLNVTIESVTRNPVTIPVTLSGFTAAFTKLGEVR